VPSDQDSALALAACERLLATSHLPPWIPDAVAVHALSTSRADLEFRPK